MTPHLSCAGGPVPDGAPPVGAVPAGRHSPGMDADDAQRREALVGLSRLAEPGDRRLVELVREAGPLEALERIRAGAGPDAYRIRLAELAVGRYLEMADSLGARIVVDGDPDWPSGLDELAAPPLCLWVSGPADLSALSRRGVAIVGSRACTAYGKRVASELAAELTDRGYLVVSGAAFGIDAAAHSGALAAGGPTVAVLACSLDRCYPSAHRDLIGRIAETGAVVSESAPPTSPAAHRFLLRNRVIAAMTAGTVVVEAGLRSGALNTARVAGDLLRPVGAVPGPVTSAASAGCHVAIREQRASLVADAADVVDLIGRYGIDAAPHPSEPPRPQDDLDEEVVRVLNAIPYRRGVDAEALTVIVGLPARQIRAALAMLELRALVARGPRGYRKTAQPPSTVPGPAPARTRPTLPTLTFE